MNEKRIIREYTARAPSWGQIVEYYQARPGRVEWLANRFPALRGEVEDTPEPTIVLLLDQEAAE